MKSGARTLKLMYFHPKKGVRWGNFGKKCPYAAGAAVRFASRFSRKKSRPAKVDLRCDKKERDLNIVRYAHYALLPDGKKCPYAAGAAVGFASRFSAQKKRLSQKLLIKRMAQPFAMRF